MLTAKMECLQQSEGVVRFPDRPFKGDIFLFENIILPKQLQLSLFANCESSSCNFNLIVMNRTALLRVHVDVFKADSFH